MKKFLSLILVFVAVFALASCDKKKSSKKEAEVTKVETVSKEISAEEGGKVESSDGKTSIEIPGGALDADTTITMTIRDSSYLPGKEDEKVISNVVELGPSGTIFKKPVVITMASAENIENKIITAAVYHEDSEEWSYSEDAAVKFSGYTETGDPIMTTATGDPIMLNATGDPIMQSATGDPIMLAATGDPIMMTATGDPIMQTATGDPIMMTTGHFTSFSFIAVTKGTVEKNDDDTDTTEPDDTDTDTTEPDDTDTSEPDGEEPADDGDTDTGEIEQEPVYSKVLCTGLRNCFGEDGMLDKCPKEGEELNGQDAGYIFRKSCVARSFERLPQSDNDPYRQTKDNKTGLTWLFTGESGALTSDLASFCDNLEYAGHDDWRIPAPQELLTIAHHDIFYSHANIMELYFPEIAGGCEGCDSFWTSVDGFFYDAVAGIIGRGSNSVFRGLMCVRGEKYGEVKSENYVTVPKNGEEMIHDLSTDLFWQKTSVGNKTWTQALEYCENLNYAGHTDWRLPNKNELATLVDFSKSNPASSFPGLPAEKFVSSTFTRNIGEVAVDMKTGEVGLIPVFAEKSIRGKRGINSGEKYSVICVRSDLTPYPENGIPACGEDGYAPCKLNNITWSSRQMYWEEAVSWWDIARYCRDRKDGKWRMPTIDEIRTLFTDDAYKPGGTCGVSTEHPESANKDDKCTNFTKTFETPLRDSGQLMSGTISNVGSNRYEWAVWMITTEVEDGIEAMEMAYGPRLIARCVLDNTIEDPENIESGLVWSSISEKGDWRDAVEYCGTLDENNISNWRLPVYYELITLIRHCNEEEAPCDPDLSGKYSIFSDIPILLTSTVFDGDYMTTLDFIDVWKNESNRLTDSYADLQVRCVHSEEDEIPAHFDEDEDFPFPLEWSVWSKKEFVYNVEEAEDFCNKLNNDGYGDDEGYGGEDFTDWQVPYISAYLDILIDKDDDCKGSCSEYLGLSDGEVQMCGCSYTFTSHSIFNDYGLFWSADYNNEDYTPHLFNFTTAEATGGSPYGDNPGYVRCAKYPIQ